MDPLATFAVSVGRKKINVAVWPDIRAFRLATNEPRTTARGYFIYDSKSLAGGTIHLMRGYLTTEIVAHESIHATARLARMRKRDIRHGRGEEDLATTAGSMAGAICGELAKLSLWEMHE